MLLATSLCVARMTGKLAVMREHGTLSAFSFSLICKE